MKQHLYAIVFKENLELLNSPKRVYLTPGQARKGFSCMSDREKSDMAIAEFTFNTIVEDGKDVAAKQSSAAQKRLQAQAAYRAKYKLKRAQEQLLEATKTIKELTNN